MIGMEITGRPAPHLFDRDALSTPKDHLGAGGASAHVELPDIRRGLGADGLCDPPAISIIDNRVRGGAWHPPGALAVGTLDADPIHQPYIGCGGCEARGGILP